MQFTACYTKLKDGYMGQLLDWPNVITDGKTIEECEEMLKDAAREMALAYYEDDDEIPHLPFAVKPISVEIEKEALLANVC
ncbi:MAG: type II toxin-antitoxin system HicB family antitoxin [Synergistaceae bacterium]|nr:type II toxin-antitoxin system HicB family antitoxin [Synergistaceae bacterium]